MTMFLSAIVHLSQTTVNTKKIWSQDKVLRSQDYSKPLA